MSCQSFESFKNSFDHKEIFLAGITFLKEKKVLFVQIKDIFGKKERLLFFSDCHCHQLETLFESSRLLVNHQLNIDWKSGEATKK